MRSALVIVNAKSRIGQESREEVVSLLREHGLALEIPPVDSPADIPALIEAWADRVDTVVLGGGDGTMNCAADALAAHDLTLGIIPLGTANDLARTLGIPANIPEACRIIAEGHRSKVDVGWVNGRHYFNVANIGLGVEVKKALTSEVKRTWGVLGYARAALEAYRRQRPFKVEIVLREHSVRLEAIQVAVGNGRFYGGGMIIHESASIADGCLDLYAIKPKSLWDLLDLGPSFRMGRLRGVDGVLQLGGREFTVRTERPMQVSADGEEITWTPADFGVAPGAASIFTPTP